MVAYYHASVFLTLSWRVQKKEKKIKEREKKRMPKSQHLAMDIFSSINEEFMWIFWELLKWPGIIPSPHLHPHSPRRFFKTMLLLLIVPS